MEAQSRDERRNPLLYLFGKTWQYSEGNRDKVVWYWIMFILANTTAFIGEPLITARIINVVQKEGVTHANYPTMLWLLSGIIAIEAVFWAFHGPARCLERKNAFLLRLNYGKFLLKGVMSLPMEWHTEHHSGDTIDKIQKGTGGQYSFAEDSFQVIWMMVEIPISVAMLFIFGNSAVTAVVVLMLIVSMQITKAFDRRLIDQYEKLDHAENKVSESVYDSIGNITTVVILRVEKFVFDAIVHKMQLPFDLFRRNQRLNEIKWALVTMCIKVMIFLALGIYFWQNIGTAAGILVGNVYLLFNYLGRIGDNFHRFTSMYSAIVRQRMRIANAEELSKDFKEESFTNHLMPRNWKRIGVTNLNFAYQDNGGDELNLENISFAVERGEKIAFVGRSGHGKSTQLKIMGGFLQPSRGKVSIDGTEVPDGFRGIRNDTSLVPQKPEIFANTFFWNLTLGAEHELCFVRRFTDMACVTDVIERMPKKFGSSIKEKGVNLSEGEQQRLALARGLLACHDKDIVLLDEPTSSLDPTTEMIVYRNIFREFQGKTIISSVHRLHLLPMFDKIYMFGRGRVVAAGALQELLATCPEFQELWQQYHQHNQ